jgi:hypothetical protein
MKIEFYNVKKGLIGFAILILLLVWFEFDGYQYDQTKLWAFKGTVKNVSYGFLRNTPVIKVNGKDYDLRKTDWDFHLKIQAGDTIVKHKGTLHIFLIKQGTRDTLNN